jgi:hypothetical protein
MFFSNFSTPGMVTIIGSMVLCGLSPSITAGEVTDDWEMAHVVPIFKKGDKSKSSNYRPVSLTSICSKIMEHILHEASNPAEGVVPDSIVMQFVDEAFMGDLIFGLGKVQENDVDLFPLR